MPRNTGVSHTDDLMSGSKKPLAVLIKGNPKYVRGNPNAAAYYDQLVSLLKDRGYRVLTNTGRPYTVPPDADVWLGHSRGADRLRFARPETVTIAIGSRQPGAINHPNDDVHIPPGSAPPESHFSLTPGMVAALDANLSKRADDGERQHSDG